MAAIAVDALGKENVIGVTMPSQYSSEDTKSDAQRLADNLGLSFLSFPLLMYLNLICILFPMFFRDWNVTLPKKTFKRASEEIY